MSLNTKPPDYQTMNYGQLQNALDKQLFLKKEMSHRLPDSGKKLTRAIEKIKSLMEEKAQLPVYRKVPSEEQLLSNAKKVLSNPKLQEIKMDSIEEEWDEILEELQFLNIGAKNPLLLGEKDERMNSVSHLTQEEINRYRRLCNLPYLRLSEDFHWFIFRLQCLSFSPTLVCLTVVDCLNPKRTLTRCGAISTWPIYRPSKQKKMLISEKGAIGAPTGTAGDAFRDLWNFIDEEQSNHQCVLIYINRKDVDDDDDDVNRLRRLFCSSRHCTAARSRLSRATFFLSLPAHCVSQRDDDTNWPAPTCLKEAFADEVFKCQRQCRGLFIDGELHKYPSPGDLFKAAPPKSTAWIEAPLNLMVLRKLALAETTQIHAKRSLTSTEALSSPVLPSNTVEGVLERLAGAGLSPTSLSLLAGVGEWHGFAGFLSSAKVTDDLEILTRLYAHFTRVYRGLALNASCFEENDQEHGSRRQGKVFQLLQDNRLDSSALTSSTVGSAVSVCAWTGSPLASSIRHVKTLSMSESIEMMQRVRKEYQAFRSKSNIPEAPSMPPKSVLFQRYRDVPSDSDDDTLTGSKSESSGTEQDNDDR